MTRRFLFVSLLALALCGCASKRPPMLAEPATSTRPRMGTGRVMIRSGSLSLRAQDLEGTKKGIEQIVSDLEGRVEQWSLSDNKRLSMTLRVPETRLDEAMDRVATLGRVVGRSLRSQDVTDEMIDLEARLSNLRALRDRLRAYLEQASNLEEILGVERELARVQSEIESLEARLKHLQSQVTMSELGVWVRRAKWL